MDNQPFVELHEDAKISFAMSWLENQHPIPMPEANLAGVLALATTPDCDVVSKGERDTIFFHEVLNLPNREVNQVCADRPDVCAAVKNQPRRYSTHPEAGSRSVAPGRRHNNNPRRLTDTLRLSNGLRLADGLGIRPADRLGIRLAYGLGFRLEFVQLWSSKVVLARLPVKPNVAGPFPKARLDVLCATRALDTLVLFVVIDRRPMRVGADVAGVEHD